MTESTGQNGGTANPRGIRPDDVLVGFDPTGDLARSNTLREVASTLATDTNMAVGQALDTAQTAADAAVKTSGDQTIEGVKTFTSIPILPDANPTGQNDAVRKKYVDDVVQGLTEWEVSVAYTHPVMVTGSDGNPYVSVQGSTGIDPATDDDESHWKRFGTSAQATEAAAGIVELADDTETQTGTDGEKAVTPAGLASVTSTETRRGLVELATQEEADAGTDTERAMTPALVKRIADNIGPPPFHVPAGSACVDDCDDAPLGWSAPAVGAANLPAEAQGGEADMIGCWQVAQTADPHGDSATSSQEELMQLYVSADGAGSNEGIWFRVRDGSFTSWTSLIGTTTPTGAIIDFSGTSAPAGYLACDGSAVSRITYARLFGVIGTRYGVGDGSTTFNVPDRRDRFGIGASSTRAVGSTGGAENVTLTTNQIPSHSHGDGTLTTSSAGSHVHGNKQYAGGNSGGAEYDTAQQRGTNYAIQNTESAGSHSHSVSGSTGSTGGGQAHENMPPYVASLYIIKT